MTDTSRNATDDAQCTVCSSPTGDGLYLCVAHTQDLTAELASVPDLVVDLEVTRTRQSRTVAERHGSRSAERPLPWNEHTAAKAFELNSTLNAWCLDVDRLGHTDTRDPLQPIHASDTAELADWLVRNLSNLRRHPDAGQAHEELTDSIRQARRAIDRPPDQVTFGPCLNDEDLDPPCPEYLYGAPDKMWVTCRGCGARHDTALRKQWMLEQMSDMAVHSGDLAIILNGHGVPIGSSTIRRWAAAGRLKVVSKDSKGRKFYRIGDVLDLAYEHRPRRGPSTTSGAA